jgi:hypothetical protein
MDGIFHPEHAAQDRQVLNAAGTPVPKFHFALDAEQQPSSMFFRRLGLGVCARTAYPPGSIYDPNMPEEQNE